LILTITLNPSIDRRYIINGFEKGRIYRVNNFQYTPGGKGLNVTKVVESFKEPVMATGFLGGKSGEYIEESLDVVGIKQNFISINEETRSCLAILSDDDSQTEILEKGPLISKEETLKFYDIYSHLIEKAEVICASGSLPEGMPAETYKHLIVMAKKQGKKFILDTSGEALKQGIEAGPFLVKPNKEELENLVGQPVTKEEEITNAAKILLGKGIKIVVVSLGKEGAIAFCGDHSYKIGVPEIKVVNPVGSGDSMIAGFAVSLLRDYNLESLLKMGAACGTANAMEPETGKVNINNVKKIMDNIIINKKKI